MTFQVDRSRILDFQSCPRKRWYGYHAKGGGLQRVSKSLPLVFGDAFHQAAEIFLSGGDVDAAVARAVNFLNLTFSLNGVDLGDEKATNYGVEEQKAIVEGLIRGWCIFKRPAFLEAFEVLEVEQEGRAALTRHSKYVEIDRFPATEEQAAQGIEYISFKKELKDCGDADIELMFRPDALVREKLTGDFYIVSWKTASTFGQYTVNQMNSDMQSMSEVWGIQNTHSPNTPHAYTADGDIIVPPFPHANIEGVLYLIAVKGQRKFDDYLGFKVQNTPLAYGWVRKGVTEDEDEWAHSYGWATEEVNPKTGKNVQTKLGKGFRKVSIWDNYAGGVKAWIDDLSQGRITPRHINPFEAIFPESLPVSRRADEIESWRRQIVSQEGRVRQRVRAVEAEPTVETLDREWPQHTARCYDYMSRCQFWDACFVPSVTSDPLSSGLYQIRSANHPERSGEEE